MTQSECWPDAPITAGETPALPS